MRIPQEPEDPEYFADVRRRWGWWFSGHSLAVTLALLLGLAVVIWDLNVWLSALYIPLAAGAVYCHVRGRRLLKEMRTLTGMD